MLLSFNSCKMSSLLRCKAKDFGKREDGLFDLFC